MEFLVPKLEEFDQIFNFELVLLCKLRFIWNAFIFVINNCKIVHEQEFLLPKLEKIVQEKELFIPKLE
jgi:hypothetical protein